MANLTQNKSEGKSIIEVLEFCKELDLPARMVGRWCWIKFDVKPSKEIRQALKSMGFRWSKRRQQWANNCGHPTKPARGYAPWQKYQTVGLDESLSRMAVALSNYLKRTDRKPCPMF